MSDSLVNRLQGKKPIPVPEYKGDPFGAIGGSAGDRIKRGKPAPKRPKPKPIPRSLAWDDLATNI